MADSSGSLSCCMLLLLQHVGSLHHMQGLHELPFQAKDVLPEYDGLRAGQRPHLAQRTQLSRHGLTQRG